MLFIFRVEHKRDKCIDERYQPDGKSLTGHGPYKLCDYSVDPDLRPNFGLSKNPPVSIMPHERCAVTAEQFSGWVSLIPDYTCRQTSWRCKEEYADPDYCWNCVEFYPGIYEEKPDWHIVAYWVEDSAKGIDWRIDSEQIVFNPEFAINMGTVEVSEVDDFVGVAA